MESFGVDNSNLDFYPFVAIFTFLIHFMERPKKSFVYARMSAFTHLYEFRASAFPFL